MSLVNLWQIRNDALPPSDKLMNDYNTQRRSLQTQIATWYDKDNEFENEDSKYFHRPYLSCSRVVTTYSLRVTRHRTGRANG